MKLPTLLCCMALLGLGACSETRFESTPGDALETCDARWKGLWLDASQNDAASGESDDLAFLVDQDCRFQLLERPEKDGPPKLIHVPVNFVHDGDKDYLVVADDQLKGIVDLPPVHGIKPQPAKAFFIARYAIDGDALKIWQADSRKLAHWIVDNRLDGTVERSKHELHVFVRGDRDAILKLLRERDVFEADPDASVRRSPLSLAEYESQRQAQRAKQAE